MSKREDARSKAIEYACEDESGARRGPYLETFPARPEQAKIAGSFDKDGARTGVWRQFHASGKLAREVSYKNGKPHGEEVSFWENGQPFARMVWVDGLLHGPACRHYESGETERCGQFVDGYMSGAWTWSPEGSKKTYEEFYSRERTVRIIFNFDRAKPRLIQTAEVVSADETKLTYQNAETGSISTIIHVRKSSKNDTSYIYKREVYEEEEDPETGETQQVIKITTYNDRGNVLEGEGWDSFCDPERVDKINAQLMDIVGQCSSNQISLSSCRVLSRTDGSRAIERISMKCFGPENQALTQCVQERAERQLKGIDMRAANDLRDDEIMCIFNKPVVIVDDNAIGTSYNFGDLSCISLIFPR